MKERRIPMDFFSISNLECQISMERANHDALTAISNFNILISDTSYLTESENNIFYESKLGDLGKKIILAIDKIIKAISDFSHKVKEKLLSFFEEKETKEKLKAIEDEIKSGKNIKLS